MRAETKSLILITVLGLLAAILKLCGVLGFSWLLVLLPFWLPLAIFVALVGGGFVTVLGAGCYLGFWGFIGRLLGKLFSKSRK